MRLTTKGRFAVTAMLDLALHSTKGPVTLSGISERQRISLSYLEQLFGKMRRRQLVESVRGPGGGYHLARDASLLTVADIISAVEESIDSTQCAGKENCLDNHRCMTHDLWSELNDTVNAFLSRVTLAHLVEKQRTKPVSVVATRRATRADGPTITV